MEKERSIYLVRHGELYEEGGIHRCLGHTDVPLTARGKRQAEKIAGWFRDKEIDRIYSSPLERCIHTARAVRERLPEEKMVPDIILSDELREMDAGAWENLSFEEIREKYPAEYEERGKHLGNYAPPGGESFVRAGRRFGRCLKKIRCGDTGNIIVVAHAGVIRGYLSGLLGISPDDVFTISQPYAGITVLKEKGDILKPERIGWRPESFLDEEELCCLYQKCHTSERTIRHMEAVAEYLEVLQRGLALKEIDWECLRKAALVHDICRAEKQHAAVGAKLLRKEGYERIAKLVEVHHSGYMEAWTPGTRPVVSEEELLFYADKRVQEDRVVTADQRFASSRERCKSPEALENHRLQYQKTKEIERKIDAIAGNREGTKR